MFLCEVVVRAGGAHHDVPQVPIVKIRENFIVERCANKRVVNFGSNDGGLHANIKKVARDTFAVDKQGTPDLKIDLDANDSFLLPVADVYVCGELIEHLSNPGNFLSRVRALMPEGSELIITTPNAFCETAQFYMKQGIENVNNDHVAWYSWHTLKILVERAGFIVREFYWYGMGSAGFNDGIIFIVT